MNAEALMKHLGIDKEHKSKIDEITKYMEEHRVQELFNVRHYYRNNFYIGNPDKHPKQPPTECQALYYSMSEEHPETATQRRPTEPFPLSVPRGPLPDNGGLRSNI